MKAFILILFLTACCFATDNCKIEWPDTDPNNSGCKECNPGFQTKQTTRRILAENPKNAKTVYLCQATNCKEQYPLTDTSNTGCKKCNDGFEDTTPARRILAKDSKNEAKKVHICRAENEKKPFYKSLWFWIILVVVLVLVGGAVYFFMMRGKENDELSGNLN